MSYAAELSAHLADQNEKIASLTAELRIVKRDHIEDMAELTRLRALNAELAEALKMFALVDTDRFTEHDEALLLDALEKARALLTRAGGSHE